MDDSISRQAAIDAVTFGITYAKAIDRATGEVKELFAKENEELRKAVERIEQLPSAQPDQSRIEKALHGLTPEEQYAFLDSLMHKKSIGWNSTALYVIAWLAGEED